MTKEWTVHNPGGARRVLVTKELPGDRWLDILVSSGCSVEVCESDDVLSADEIKERIGNSCDAVIGQLTEAWSAELFAALAAVGGTAYSNRRKSDRTLSRRANCLVNDLPLRALITRCLRTTGCCAAQLSR